MSGIEFNPPAYLNGSAIWQGIEPYRQKVEETAGFLAGKTGIDATWLKTGLEAGVLGVFAVFLFCAMRFCLRRFFKASRTGKRKEEKTLDARNAKAAGRAGARAPLASALGSVRGGFIAVACFSFVINLLMLVSPLYMLQVYDRVLTSRSLDTLLYLTLLAVTLTAFNAFLELVRSRILVRIGGRLDEELGETVFRKLFEWRKDGQSANTLALSDLATVRNFLSGSGPNAFFDAPWTPVFIALIFLFHPLLGIIATCGAALLFALALISEFATRGAYARASGKSRAAMQFADAAIRNIEVIRGMGMLAQLTGRWAEKNREGLACQGLANDRVGLLTAVSKFIRPGLQIAMLGAGAYLVIGEAASPGIMIASSIIMGRALQPVEAAVSQWRTFVSARAAYGRLKALFAVMGTMPPQISLPRPEGHLKVEGLTLVPPGAQKPVLHEVGFELAAGEILAVIGASAAGKSTLARALVGVWPQKEGYIRIDGSDISQWIGEELGQYIGYLPQDVELFDGTVAENIARFAALDSEKAIAAAKLAGAHGMILHLEKGYDTPVGPQGSALSGGQRQRIGLARALYGDPAFIVLDEPNASLDSTGEKALMATLEHLRGLRRTAVVISHRSNVLSAVDRILILNAGRVEAFDRRERIVPKIVGQTAQPLRAVHGAKSGTIRKEDDDDRKETLEAHHATA